MADDSQVASCIPGRYAAIDIGTVTCRLLVADVDSRGQLDEVHREGIICNLGEGVDETRRLSPEAIERVGAAIEQFNETLEQLRLSADLPIPLSAVATSASRDAENAAEFQERLAKAGLTLQVVPGQREAALSFAGAASAFRGEDVVVWDIGGGSTEIIAGRSGDEPRHARSFNVGCRRVTERFFKSDPPSEYELSCASKWIDAEFASYLTELREDGSFDGRVAAVAGTATSVISMREKMVPYDRSLVHGSIASRADVDRLLRRLSCMTEEQRMHVSGLHPGRAPVIVAGLLILQRVMELAHVDAFTVSESDILHGIIYDMARAGHDA